MAMADYYLCDKCGRKAFYDANVSWEYFKGEIKALCEQCSQTHEIVVQPKAVQ